MNFNFSRLGSSQDDDVGASPQKRVRLEDLSLSTAGNVTEVGTTTPADDFNKLLQQGFDLSTGKLFLVWVDLIRKVFALRIWFQLNVYLPKKSYPIIFLQLLLIAKDAILIIQTQLLLFIKHTCIYIS